MSRTAIKIISINTWKCEGDYVLRLRAIANQLQRYDAQVLLCQECFRTQDGEYDTIRHLSEELEMPFIFTPGRFKERLIDGQCRKSWSGLGVLSSLPCTLIKELVLPAVSEDPDRSVQIVSVMTSEGVSLGIANIHLTHLRESSDLRMTQLKCVVDELTRLEGKDLRLMVGDFNATVESPELTYLKGHAIHCSVSESSSDDSPNDFQISSRVDHIFALNQDLNSDVQFTSSGIILNDRDPETNVYPSDHPAITTTLVFTKTLNL